MGISPISTPIMQSVIELKSASVQKEIDSLWKGTNGAREITYRVSDASTAVFAVFQAASLFVVTSGTILVGSIFGIVAGVLTTFQGIFLLPDAVTSLCKKQWTEGGRKLWDSLFLILTGVVMILISLAAATALLSAAAGIIAFLSNPYALATIFFLSSFFGFCDAVRLLRSHTAAQLLEHLKTPDALKEDLLKIVPFKPKDQHNPVAIAQWHIDLAEQLAQDMGVEATLPMMKLIAAALENTPSSREEVEAEIAAWNHKLWLRFWSNLLYILSSPLGAIAATFRTAAKIATLVSNLCISGGGALATRLDSYPFARGSSVSPKAPTPEAVIAHHKNLIFS